MDEEMHLLNAQDQISRYVRHIDEAAGSGEPGEMRRYLREAVPFGQNTLDDLDEALNMTEDPLVAEAVEGAMRHIAWSIDQGDQAIEASDDEMEELVSDMRKQAQQAASYLAEAMGTIL